MVLDGDAERALVIVNFADTPAQAHVHVPWDDLGGRSWRLEDPLSGDGCDRNGDEMQNVGLYVELSPWRAHLLKVRGL